jgi:hypothetical protein
VVFVVWAMMLARSLNKLEHQDFGYQVQGRVLGKGDWCLMDPIGTLAVDGFPNRLKGWSGGRGSNPRRPAWEIGRRLKIQNLASTGLIADDPKPLILQGPDSGRALMDSYWTLCLFLRPLVLVATGNEGKFGDFEAPIHRSRVWRQVSLLLRPFECVSS